MRERKESLTKKVWKYAAGGVVGAVIGMGLGMLISGKILDYRTSQERAKENYPVEMSLLMYICESTMYSVYGVALGGYAGFPLGLAGYHGIRKLRERKLK